MPTHAHTDPGLESRANVHATVRQWTRRPTMLRGNPRARRTLTLVIAALAFVTITILRLQVDGLDAAIAMLYVFPVALIAAEFEVLAGVAAGMVASLAFGAWVVATEEQTHPGYLAVRVAVLVGIGGVIGWMSRQRHYDASVVRAVLDALPDPASVKDTTGRYLLANEALGKVLKVDPADIVGRRDPHGQPDETREQVEGADRTVIETAAPVEYEVTAEIPELGPMSMRTLKAPVLDDAGRVVAIVTIAHDITQRVAHEREVVRLATQAREEYERAIGHYAQLIRHRVANPLTVIEGAAETLRSELGRDDAARVRFADLISEQVERLQAISFGPEQEGIEERELDAIAAADLDPVLDALREITRPRSRPNG